DARMRPPSSRSRSASPPRRPPRMVLAPEHVAQRPLECPSDASLPELVVRSPTWHNHLFKKRLGAYPPLAQHGDYVRLVAGDGQPLGVGYFNPRAEIAARVLARDAAAPDREWWDARLRRALDLRQSLLQLDGVTTACRLVHAEGDGCPGLVVDRYGETVV